MNDHILGIIIQLVTNQPNCTVFQSIFHFLVNFYCRNSPVWQTSILKQAFMSNFFLRILQSNLNSQCLISIYPLNEASQDPTGLKTNGSKITELLIVSLLSSLQCQEEDPSFLRITEPCALYFYSIPFSSSGPSPTNLLLSLKSPTLL